MTLKYINPEIVLPNSPNGSSWLQSALGQSPKSSVKRPYAHAKCHVARVPREQISMTVYLVRDDFEQ